MRHTLTLVSFLFLTIPLFSQTTTVTFEDNPLPPGSFYNGANLAGGFTSGGAFFNNTYTPAFGSWSGWSYSNIQDTTTAGFGNQYAAYALPTGGGDGNTGHYGVAFNFDIGDARITLPAGRHPLSVKITNTTYTGLSMLNGDSFSKKFGGITGNDPDFFLLKLIGRDANNALTGEVPFYLADYRFANNTQDYIINQWTTVDLSTLASSTRTLTFELTSSDNGMFGMNTPAYFALDTLVLAVPEPTTLALVSGLVLSLTGGWWWKRRHQLRQST